MLIRKILVIIALGVLGYAGLMWWLTSQKPKPQTNEKPSALSLTNTEREYKVYFAKTDASGNVLDCSRVSPVPRTFATRERAMQEMLNTLFLGPSGSEAVEGYTSLFSARTSRILKGVRVENGKAYVNLTDLRSIIPGANSSCGSAQFFASVEATVKQFGTVDKVFYAIDEDPAAFYEWMQVGCVAANNYCDPAPFGGRSAVSRCDPAPAFDDYETPDSYAGVPAEPDFASDTRSQMFRTQIVNGAKEGPNFAGHYTVISWGCGTSCQSSAIVDAVNGKIAYFGIASEYGLAYRLDSSLIVVNPAEYVSGVARESVRTAYYVFESGKLRELCM